MKKHLNKYFISPNKIKVTTYKTISNILRKNHKRTHPIVLDEHELAVTK